MSWFFRCSRVKRNNKKIITLWFHNSCIKRLEENLNSTTLLITKPLCAAVSAEWLQCHMMLSSLTILVLWHSRLKELWAVWRYAGGGGGRGWRVHPFVLRAISCLFSSFPWTVKLFFVLLSGPEIWTNHSSLSLPEHITPIVSLLFKLKEHTDSQTYKLDFLHKHEQ